MTKRIREYLVLFSFAGLILAGVLPAHAVPKYIGQQPLSDAVSAPVGSVARGKLNVPMITWGGDVATIYANGNQLNTVSGSLFAQQGLQITLYREDRFQKQVEDYLHGKTPFLRGTLGMINQALDVLNRDPRTEPIVIYQLTWSAGGDALVVKESIKKVADLRGKTIALQAYGPHVDYLVKLLQSAGLSLKDVKVKWLPDLTGTDDSPPAALYEADVDAVMAIIPDALALTSNGTVGTGAEGSVRGARILLSTKTANRVIADVYAVRSDFLQAHRDDVEKFVHGLLLAEEAIKPIMGGGSDNPKTQLLRAAGQYLLDSPEAVSDAEGLYQDAQYVGFAGNVKFFTDAKFPRNLQRMTQEIQSGLIPIGLISRSTALAHAGWNYGNLASGLQNTAGVEVERFKADSVASVVARKQQQGAMDSGTLFQFEVYFKPNQSNFSRTLYADSFKKVVDLAAAYGGAVITVEGHSDPLGYLRKKQSGTTPVLLQRMRQSAKNLSYVRARTVRDSLIGFATEEGVTLDPSQFVLVGQGIENPKSGLCGADPCAPKTEQEWRSNMRVVFRVIQIEAEESAFRPL